MMVFTHVLVGIVAGAIVVPVSSYDPAVCIAAGGLGGFLPDADMLGVHRRTLHFPVVYPVIAVGSALGAVLTGVAVLWLLTTAAGAAGAHTLMDTIGGGKEMRPWRETDDRAVFNHVAGEWVAPLRLFYDGSAPDLGIAVGAGALAAWLLPSRFDTVLVVLLLFALAYTAVRRVITTYIPERYPTFSSYIQAKLLGRDSPSE